MKENIFFKFKANKIHSLCVTIFREKQYSPWCMTSVSVGDSFFFFWIHIRRFFYNPLHYSICSISTINANSWKYYGLRMRHLWKQSRPINIVYNYWLGLLVMYKVKHTRSNEYSNRLCRFETRWICVFLQGSIFLDFITSLKIKKIFFLIQNQNHEKYSWSLQKWKFFCYILAL